MVTQKLKFRNTDTSINKTMVGYNLTYSYKHTLQLGDHKIVDRYRMLVLMIKNLPEAVKFGFYNLFYDLLLNVRELALQSTYMLQRTLIECSKISHLVH